MEYVSRRPQIRRPCRKIVLELMCGVGSVSVKELCYVTGALRADGEPVGKAGLI